MKASITPFDAPPPDASGPATNQLQIPSGRTEIAPRRPDRARGWQGHPPAGRGRRRLRQHRLRTEQQPGSFAGFGRELQATPLGQAQ
ncbi:MAG: hypothetical protein R3349_11445, partial [Geminicoccaceae bacterium]|nr:hypothetical protein [Geminicoccaceae bacterium]